MGGVVARVMVGFSTMVRKLVLTEVGSESAVALLPDRTQTIEARSVDGARERDTLPLFELDDPCSRVTTLKVHSPVIGTGSLHPSRLR